MTKIKPVGAVTEDTSGYKLYKKYYAFWKEDDQQKLRNWWLSLKKNTGWRAELRRAESPADVLLSEGFRYLCYDLSGWWTQEPRLLGLAAVAGILAHIDSNDEEKSFATQCASSGEGQDKPQMSELRFSQIQKSRTLDELFTRMIRGIHLLKKRANIISVADSIFHWTKEMIDGDVDNEPRNHILVRWGMDYFQALQKQKASNK